MGLLGSMRTQKLWIVWVILLVVSISVTQAARNKDRKRLWKKTLKNNNPVTGRRLSGTALTGRKRKTGRNDIQQRPGQCNIALDTSSILGGSAATELGKDKVTVGIDMVARFHLHYNPANDKCDEFLGWDGVQQSQAWIYALGQIAGRFTEKRQNLSLTAPYAIAANVTDSCANHLLGAKQVHAAIIRTFPAAEISSVRAKRVRRAAKSGKTTRRGKKKGGKKKTTSRGTKKNGGRNSNLRKNRNIQAGSKNFTVMRRPNREKDKPAASTTAISPTQTSHVVESDQSQNQSRAVTPTKDTQTITSNSAREQQGGRSPTEPEANPPTEVASQNQSRAAPPTKDTQTITSNSEQQGGRSPTELQAEPPTEVALKVTTRYRPDGKPTQAVPTMATQPTVVTSKQPSQVSAQMSQVTPLVVAPATVPLNVTDACGAKGEPIIPQCLRSHFAGMIGPVTSKEVSAVSPMLSTYGISHISYWADDRVFDDLAEYPYLFRTVPSAAYQAQAIGDLLVEFGWSYTILIGDGEEYNSWKMDAISRYAQRSGNFCVGTGLIFRSGNPASIQRVISYVLMEDAPTAIVLIADVHHAAAFFRHPLASRLKGKIFLGGSDWVSRLSLDITKRLEGIGILGLTPRIAHSDRTQQLARQFEANMRTESYLEKVLPLDPWLQTQLESQSRCQYANKSCKNTKVQKQLRHCTTDDIKNLTQSAFSFSMTEPLIFAVEVLLQAVSEIATASDWLSDKTCVQLSRVEVLKKLHTLKVPCKNGRESCQAFDNITQSVPPAYYVQNLHHSGTAEFVKVGLWSAKKCISCKKRRTSTDSTSGKVQWIHDFLDFGDGAKPFNFSAATWPTSNCDEVCLPGQRRKLKKRNSCCWTCVSCPFMAISERNNSRRCSKCKFDMKANSKKTQCIPVPVVATQWPDVPVVMLVVLAALGASLTAFTFGYFLFHREASIVRSLDIYISTLVLFSMTFGHISAPIVGGALPLSDASCKAQVLLGEVWKTAVISGVLVKTNRFVAIFNTKVTLQHLKWRHFLMGTPMQIFAVLLLSAITLIVETIYVAVRPPNLDVTLTPYVDIRKACDISVVWSAVLYAFNFVLAVACMILAFLTRNLPEAYNQAWLLYVASLTICTISVGFMPAYFITEKKLKAVVSALFLEAVLWAMWTCLYAPRLYKMIRCPNLRQRPRRAGVHSIRRAKDLRHGSTQSASMCAENKTSLSVVDNDDWGSGHKNSKRRETVVRTGGNWDTFQKQTLELMSLPTLKKDQDTDETVLSSASDWDKCLIVSLFE